MGERPGSVEQSVRPAVSSQYARPVGATDPQAWPDFHLAPENKYPSFSGKPPVFKESKDDFSESEKGQEIASSIFGDESFTKKDDKK